MTIEAQEALQTADDIPAIVTQLRQAVGKLTAQEAAVSIIAGARAIRSEEEVLALLLIAALKKEGLNPETATPEQVEAATERATQVLQAAMFDVAATVPNSISRPFLEARRARRNAEVKP